MSLPPDGLMNPNAGPRNAARTQPGHPKRIRAAMPGLAIGLWGSLACTPASFFSEQQNWINPGAAEAFASCPAPAGAPVGDGALWLQVTPEYFLCSEVRSDVDSVLDMLARKTQVHLVAGDYFLPTDPGTYELPLAFCGVFQNQNAWSIDAKRPGKLEVRRNNVLGYDYLGYQYQNTFVDEEEQTWHFRWRLEGYEEDFRQGIRLDERIWDFPTPKTDFLLCRREDCADSQDLRALTACEHAGWRMEQHHIAYASGQVTFDLMAETDVWPARTQMRAARGEHRGVAFDIEDYWLLDVILSEPWASLRDLVVLFPAPIEDACGLVVQFAQAYRDAGPLTEVYELDCENNLVASELRSASWNVVDDGEDPIE